jgi:hypothetical protein
MGRKTATFDDEQAAWIERMADKTGLTQSQIISQSVEYARGGTVPMWLHEEPREQPVAVATADDQEASADVDDQEPASADVPAGLREQIEALDPPGDEYQQADRRGAVRQALAFLIAEGEADRQTFEAFLDRDVVDHHYADGHSAYKNWVHSALKELAEGDDRLRPSGARTPWRWSG